jgi:ankyrin repeat protein
MLSLQDSARRSARHLVGDGRQYRALCVAICNHAPLTIIRHLIADASVNVNAFGGRGGRTALRLALELARHDVVACLLRAPGISSHQCLYDACHVGDAALARDLLKRHPEIDVNAVDACGDNTAPLIFACRRGHAQVVRELLARPGIDVNATSDIVGATGLSYACACGHAGVVAALLSHPGIDLLQASLSVAIAEQAAAECPDAARAAVHASIAAMIRGAIEKISGRV